MIPKTCYCGCHDGEPPRVATEVDPETGYPICSECLVFALNDGDEVVCSRDSEYRSDQAGWRYFDERTTSREG